MTRRPFKASRRLVSGLLLAALALAGCQKSLPMASASEATPFTAEGKTRDLSSWQDDVIYFVLTDRFHNGNRSNDFNVKANDPHAYHGGDFDGIIKKLDYIKDLGATAIWITPINDNKDDSLVGKYWGFHGYWAHNWEKVDEHLGDEAKFKELVRAAHAKGIKVMLDIVANHAGYDAPHTKDASKKDWFHHNGNIENWDDQGQLEYRDIHGLPDYNTENPAVINYMEDMWSGWISRTGIDAFRVDTVKHVPMAFWSRFNKTIKSRAKKDFLILGEVLHGDPGYVAPYTREGQFDTVFDFPMYFTMADVFARGQSMRKLGDRLRSDRAYKDASILSPFLDNHDVPRFLSTAGGDERKLRLALSFLFTMRGIPTMYYGTENGMKGAGEPENREDMQFGANPKLTSYVRTLMHLRQELAPLRRGEMLEMWQDDDVYGYSRKHGNDEVLVFLNNDNKAQTREVPLRAESSLGDGTTLLDRLGGSDRVTIANRKIRVTLGPKEAKVFVVASRKQAPRTRK
jgi:alpha-amylase